MLSCASLGNAVPSALAELLGNEIRRQLFGDEVEAGKRPSLIPERRLPVPAAGPTVPVPEKYLHRVGDHAPHPGTGQGYGALERSRQT